MSVQQSRLNEHHLGVNFIDLPAVGLQAVAVVGVAGGGLTLVRGEKVQYRQIVVFQYIQPAITAPQVELLSHHIHDLVG